MFDDLNEILEEMGYDWEAVDDCVLVTCCGDSVEWDCPRCPTCSTVNPLITMAII